MSMGVTINDFIRSLMRKLFTEEYLATKTFTKMEKYHQIAIIGCYFICLFYSVKNKFTSLFKSRHFLLNCRCRNEKVSNGQASCDCQPPSSNWGLRQALYGYRFPTSSYKEEKDTTTSGQLNSILAFCHRISFFWQSIIDASAI